LSAAATAPPLNALQANIAARGANAYYHAHANSSGGLRTTLGEAPRLLATAAMAAGGGGGGGGGAASSPEAPALRTARPVESFSWADDGDSVRVYVGFEGASAKLSEADVTLTVAERAARSFALEIRPPGTGYALVLKRDGLYADVSGGRVRRLKDRVLVILTKSEPASPWYELEAPSRVGGDD
jgi:hypothetical protein